MHRSSSIGTLEPAPGPIPGGAIHPVSGRQLPCLSVYQQVSLVFSVKALKAGGIAEAAARCNPSTHIFSVQTQKGQVIAAELCRSTAHPHERRQGNFKNSHLNQEMQDFN